MNDGLLGAPGGSRRRLARVATAIASSAYTETVTPLSYLPVRRAYPGAEPLLVRFALAQPSLVVLRATVGMVTTGTITFVFTNDPSIALAQRLYPDANLNSSAGPLGYPSYRAGENNWVYCSVVQALGLVPGTYVIGLAAAAQSVSASVGFGERTLIAEIWE